MAAAPVAARIRPTALRGVTYNALTGRDPDRVAAFVETLMAREGLDFVCLQEAQHYSGALRAIHGVQLISPPGLVDEFAGGHETGVVVANRIGRTQAGRVPMTRKTWVTTGGATVPPRTMATVRLDGWLTVGSVHFPPSVHWYRGRPQGPARRVEVYRSMSRHLVRWVHRTGGPVLVAADWNEPADTRGRFTPRWVARRTGAELHTNGGIDFVLARGPRVGGVKAIADRGGSDHRAHLFTVHPPPDFPW